MRIAVGNAVSDGTISALQRDMLNDLGDWLARGIFGPSDTYTATTVYVMAVLALVGVAATIIPSRAAARIDPQLALKSD